MLRNGYFGKSEFDVPSFPKGGRRALWFRTSCGVKAAQEKGEQRRRTGRSAGAAGVLLLLLGGSPGLGRPDRRSARAKGAARARDRRALCLVSRGGVSKARYLLDNPDVVRGKSVLDLGSGCGATAIAAKMSGASRILANDIDPIAGMAITLNCELNQLNPLPILTKNILDLEPDKWDLVVLGDMFYDEDLADGLYQWLKNCFWTHRTRVLIGDPGRPQFSGHSIQHQLRKVVEYSLPEPTRRENNGLTTSTVWDFQP
ncbi:electron transfer flavoprotein beta subunit lysine methyltransferase isoform X2 [Equus przewalskii]